MKKKTIQAELVSQDKVTGKYRYAVSRRRLLQSLAAGGAAVTVKVLPEQWAKPMLESTTLPAHAVTTLPADFSLTCEVGGFDTSSDEPFETSFDGNLVTEANSPGALWPLISDSLPITFTIDNLNATTDPVAVPISLSIGASGEAVIDTGGTATVPHDAPNGNTTDFGVLEVTLNDSGPDSTEGTVDFNFSAGGQTCEIDLVFLEYPAAPGP